MTESVTQPGVAAALGINGKLFFAQLVNFGAVVFVVWKWVYKPLLRTMDAREKKIADGLADSELAKKLLIDSERQQAALLKEARAESQAILDAARSEAEAERKKLTEETSRELERQLVDARERLKREKEAMMKAVRNEIANLVIAATEKVANAMDADAQGKLAQEAIDDLERTASSDV